MTNFEDLINRARRDEAITSLPAHAKRGAEAYLQSYGHVASGSPDTGPMWLRLEAMRYLIMTASPPLTIVERDAAMLARKTLKRLSR